MRDVPMTLTFSVPEPCGDEANELRRMHADLADMPAWELEAEGYRARMAVCFGAFHGNMWAREWTRERLEACQAEARRRKAVRRG